MLEFNKDRNEICYDYSRCQQCGICEAVCSKQAISLELRKDGTNQIKVDNDKCIRCKRCVNCCPANKHENYEGYFDNFAGKEYYLGYNTNPTVRHECSSGGVCKTIVIESLRNGLADGVYTLRRTDVFPIRRGGNSIRKTIFRNTMTSPIQFTIQSWHVGISTRYSIVRDLLWWVQVVSFGP